MFKTKNYNTNAFIFKIIREYNDFEKYFIISPNH